MTLTLNFIRETAAARLYAKADGSQQWIPRSVCQRTLKWPGKDGHPPVHQVDVEDWWLEKNPWPESKQKALL